jgi:uncharacterized protein HemX
MNDTPRADTTPDTHPPAPGAVRKKSGKGVLWGLLAVIIAFSAGFLWQFFEASTVRADLGEAERSLVEERLRVRLGQAALAAQSGEYESARLQMSEFFSQAQENAGALTTEVRGVTSDFLAMRDEIITGLSRSNPEYADVLYGMLETLGSAIEGPQATDIGEPVEPGGTTPEP